MANKTFGARTGDLERKSAFIQEHWSAVGGLKEFNPSALANEVAAVLAIDASQEAQKGRKVERTSDAREAMRKALAAAAPILDELRAGIKRLARPALLKGLPKLNADFTFEAKIGGLKSLVAFIQENPEAARKIDKSEVTALRKATDAAVAAEATSDSADLALPATTRTLEEKTRETSLRVTAALDILQGVFTLLGDRALLEKARGIRTTNGPKPAPKQGTKTPDSPAKA